MDTIELKESLGRQPRLQKRGIIWGMRPKKCMGICIGRGPLQDSPTAFHFARLNHNMMLKKQKFALFSYHYEKGRLRLCYSIKSGKTQM
uniref:Uncharacterized protein n=1 Tax=Rhizophora mucronata TaxID=61149 RepID=A0A2P2N275_RHIMU